MPPFLGKNQTLFQPKTFEPTLPFPMLGGQSSAMNLDEEDEDALLAGLELPTMAPML